MPAIWVWGGAVAIGLSLGLLGSGGSILTVPVLVYLAGRGEKVAIAESLAIVGAIAAAASLPHVLERRVDWRAVAVFGLPGMLGAWVGASAAAFVSGAAQLALFAVIMLAAAGFMLRPPRLAGRHEPRATWKIALDGLLVGAVTGLVGVGGGFMIVPALVLLGGLPLPRAIASSLAIIALKSAVGFATYLDVLAGLGQRVDWSLIATISALGVAGSMVGRRLGARLGQARLRVAFGLFLIAMGCWILAQRLPGLVGSA